MPGIGRAAGTILADLAHQHGLPQISVQSGAPLGFRHRARLAIRGRRGSPKIGLFQADTHRVVHIPHCLVQHPLINEVAAVVRSALVGAGITCYSDRAHLGLARYLQVVVERRSASAQVVLVANATEVDPLVPCLDLIRERLGSRLHSLWVNFNTQPTNTILGEAFHHYCGAEAVVENFGGADVYYPPGAFGQSNPEVAQQIIAQIRAWVAPQSQVTEFYAGVGAIGLSLLERVGTLRLNEANAYSLRGLQLGLAQLPPRLRDRTQVLPGAAGSAVAAARDAQLVIVDPPRKGLDAPLVEALAAHPPAELIYVSCALASLQQDLQRLLGGGQLRLTQLQAYNLMPFTEHVETVARLVRANIATLGA